MIRMPKSCLLVVTCLSAVTFHVTAAERFVRGDADADGEILVSDGLFTLNFLFLGGIAPPCLDAADANDVNGVDITDAVFVFWWLFLGGEPPPAPTPSGGGYLLSDCGLDQTADDVPCASFPPCPQTKPPTAAITAHPGEGLAPLTVAFFATDSTDPDGEIVQYDWQFGEGSVAQGSFATYTFETPGDYRVRLTVTDDLGAEATDEFVVAVPGWALATVAKTSPMDGEQAVALTRETVVEFSSPVASDDWESAIEARFGGHLIPARAEVSQDARTVTFFYGFEPDGNGGFQRIDGTPLPPSSRVRVTINGDLITDLIAGRAVDANSDGLEGGIAFFDFDTCSIARVSDTVVLGRVFASQPATTPQGEPIDVPLQGVTITVDGLPEAELVAVTDDEGRFELVDTPTGRIFVHIDGRSVITDDGAYPSVGKAWEAAAGQDNSVGDIFLPLIRTGTLQPVSSQEETRIVTPLAVVEAFSDDPEQRAALSSIELVVPANTLYFEDGTRGGRLGIAPVAPQRLPGELPPGLEFPIVVTVQTDGATNFDDPVPICFPNLEGLEPGSIDFLYSFDHDKGSWEPIGSMTVSDDGARICTDDGVGIVAPGWHANGPRPCGPPGPKCDPSRQCCPQPPSGSCGGGSIGVVGDGQLAATDPCCQAEPGDDEECAEAARDWFRKHQNENTEYLKWCRKNCDENHDDPETCKEDLCWTSYINRGRSFTRELNRRLERCKKSECSDSQDSCEESIAQVFQPLLEPAVVEGDDTKRDVMALADELTALLFPLGNSPDPIPAETDQKIDELFAAMDTIANGDASSILVQSARDIEVRLAAKVGEPLGRIVPQPVAYSATVRRSNDVLVLRGMTDPSGRYQLFLPRGGDLSAVSFFDSVTWSQALVTPNLRAGTTFDLPEMYLTEIVPEAVDFDNDDLSEFAESVLGTDPANPDSDGDGISDSAEVRQGTNPLDSRPAIIGVVGSVDTPGTAVDVCAVDDVAVVADSVAGISVVDVSPGRSPTVIAQVDTPGSALRVACSGSLVGVADGSGGLVVVDITDPPAASILYQVGRTQLGGNAEAIVAGNIIAYVGTSSSEVVALDLRTGQELGRVELGGLGEPIHDLALAGDSLYVVKRGALIELEAWPGFPREISRAELVWGADLITRRHRVSAGDGWVYVASVPGYSVFEARPVLRESAPAVDNGDFNSFRQIVPTGSGIGVAVAGVRDVTDGTQHVHRYDLRDPTISTSFETTIVTPGVARALAIYNGVAFVADSDAGLQVVNYAAYDASGIAPSIEWGDSRGIDLQALVAERGAFARVTASVRDDVQVREVAFEVDGVTAFVDGSFPFEYRFVVPANRAEFSLSARAVDTGGNGAETDLLRVALVDDATRPVVANTLPADMERVLDYEFSLRTSFSEAIDVGSFSVSSMELTRDGAKVVVESVSYDPETLRATFSLIGEPDPGAYVATLRDVTDLAGNLLEDFTWRFDVIDTVDIVYSGVVRGPQGESLANVRVSILRKGETLTAVDGSFRLALRALVGSRLSMKFDLGDLSVVLCNELVEDEGEFDLGTIVLSTGSRSCVPESSWQDRVAFEELGLPLLLVEDCDDFTSGQEISELFGGILLFEDPPTSFYGNWGEPRGEVDAGGLLPAANEDLVMLFPQPVLGVGAAVFDDGRISNAYTLTVTTTEGDELSVSEDVVGRQVGFLGYTHPIGIEKAVFSQVGLHQERFFEIDRIRVLR